MKHFNPTEAHAFLQSHPEAVFIDCRSEIEYLFVGHPIGAIHIAWQDGPDWDVNPDFLGHSRKAASTRVCQPSPLSRNWSTTSRDNRMVMRSLVGVF